MRTVIKKYKTADDVIAFFDRFLSTNKPLLVGATKVTLDRQNWHADNGTVDNIGNLLQGRIKASLREKFAAYSKCFVTITVNTGGHIKEILFHPDKTHQTVVAFHRSGVAGRAFRKSTSLLKRSPKAAGKVVNGVCEAGATVALSPLYAMDGVDKMIDVAMEKFNRGGGAVYFGPGDGDHSNDL